MRNKIFNRTTFLWISFFLMSIGFVSCNKDDDDLTSNYTTYLFGKWQVTVDEMSDAYVVTFNPDKTALIEQYKEFEVYGLSNKDGECKVAWSVEKDKIVFEGGKAWFAFGYTPVTLVSVSQNLIIGSQWFKESNVKFTRL